MSINKPILKGKKKTFFYLWEIGITFTAIVFDFKEPFKFIVLFLALLTLAVSFFNIYNPNKSNRIKYLWNIKLFLFGEDEQLNSN